MAETFNWTPSKSFSKQTKPNVHTIQFGDGYSQRIRQGINTLTISWSLSFINQPLDIATGIVDFLEARAGTEYFLFTPPYQVILGQTPTTYKVICSEWEVEQTSHISKTINAKFDVVYDLA